MYKAKEIKARSHEATVAEKRLLEESKWKERELNVMEKKVTIEAKKAEVELTMLQIQQKEQLLLMHKSQKSNKLKWHCHQLPSIGQLFCWCEALWICGIFHTKIPEAERKNMRQMYKQIGREGWKTIENWWAGVDNLSWNRCALVHSLTYVQTTFLEQFKTQCTLQGTRMWEKHTRRVGEKNNEIGNPYWTMSSNSSLKLIH